MESMRRKKANLGACVLKNYATTDELQHKATLAAKILTIKKLLKL